MEQLRLGSIAQPLRKRDFFRKVFLEAGAPTWPNGFDICADLIHLKGTAVSTTDGTIATTRMDLALRCPALLL